MVLEARGPLRGGGLSGHTLPYAGDSSCGRCSSRSSTHHPRGWWPRGVSWCAMIVTCDRSRVKPQHGNCDRAVAGTVRNSDMPGRRDRKSGPAAPH